MTAQGNGGEPAMEFAQPVVGEGRGRTIVKRDLHAPARREIDVMPLQSVEPQIAHSSPFVRQMQTRRDIARRRLACQLVGRFTAPHIRRRCDGQQVHFPGRFETHASDTG